MGKAKSRVIRDLVIILFSIFLAILLARSGTIDSFIKLFEGSFVLTALIGGILFTSVFTTAIGTAIFFVLGIDGYNPFLIAFIGGTGALVGDLLIFHFVRAELVTNLEALLEKKTRRKLEHVTHHKVIAFGLALLGGIIIASPFPDELGIAFLAASGLKNSYFSIISYILNFFGILAIVFLGELF